MIGWCILQYDPHAEEDGEGVTEEPGDAQPEEGEALLPAGGTLATTAYNTTVVATPTTPHPATVVATPHHTPHLKRMPMSTMKAENIQMTRILLYRMLYRVNLWWVRVTRHKKLLKKQRAF